MATKQINSNEKRKHSTSAPIQRKEKSQKTSKTENTIKETFHNVTANEKKTGILYSISIVLLGRLIY